MLTPEGGNMFLWFSLNLLDTEIYPNAQILETVIFA